MRQHNWIASIVVLMALAGSSVACARRTPSLAQAWTPADDDALAHRLVDVLARACPTAPPDDLPARDSCASQLASLPLLEQRMAEPFLFGAQVARGAYDFVDRRVTQFNPLVWRKMYLSLEMFTGDYRVEHSSGRTIVIAETRFRGKLDEGEYPYPFWHSRAKWESYEFAIATIFVVDGGRIVGALRSANQDRGRPSLERQFDGDWDASAQGRPAVLYRRLFSPSNPYVSALDDSFRAFEAEARPYECTHCHRPDNPAGQAQLEMLIYPNQALVSRHALARHRRGANAPGCAGRLGGDCRRGPSQASLRPGAGVRDYS